MCLCRLRSCLVSKTKWFLKLKSIVYFYYSHSVSETNKAWSRELTYLENGQRRPPRITDYRLILKASHEYPCDAFLSLLMTLIASSRTATSTVIVGTVYETPVAMTLLTAAIGTGHYLSHFITSQFSRDISQADFFHFHFFWS